MGNRVNNSKTNNNKKKYTILIVKGLLFLALITGILFLSFWIILIGAFSAKNVVLYTGFGLAVLGVPLLIISIFFRRISGRIKVYLWCGLLALFTIPIIISESYRYYDRNFARLNEDGIEVLHYRPFIEGTKAVYLDEPSTLNLTDPLPKLDGARALYPVYASFAQAIYPSREYDLTDEVGYTNTINAYKQLINRVADIIFVVSPSEEQLQEAKNKHVEMKFTAIGQDAFVFFVNAKNPIDNLTSKQIRDIYGGKIKNWSQVGGNKQVIKAFQRNQGSGSQTAFLSFMHGNPVMDPPTEDIIQGMGGIIEETANYTNYPNSIGFSFRYFSQTMIINNEIKLLSIDDVYPSIETITSGKYPLTVSFYAVTLADNNKPDVERMIKWILSSQGQKIVEKIGYVPIK